MKFAYTSLLNSISIHYFGKGTIGTHPQQRDFVRGFMSLNKFVENPDIGTKTLDEYMAHIKLKLIMRPAPKELL